MALQKVLIIGFVWPEPNSTAAGSRILQLIELFKKAGFKITFASTAALGEHSFDLKNLGIETATIKLNCGSFDTFVKDLSPTIVVFDRFLVEEQFGWRLAENCPNALRVLDTEDLHFLRIARQKCFKEGKEFTFNDLHNDTAKREIASIYRSDVSLIISDFEMDLLERHFKINKQIIHYIPFLLDPISQANINSWPDFHAREHFVTIGNFLHEPNWNSVLYLKQEIWPLIRKQLPKANMLVYGAYASQKVYELHDIKQGFYIMGRAEQAKTVVNNARVFLAPLRFGAGIKGKLVEAMQCGTPSVTSFIGSEGMHGKFPWNGSVVNEPIDFANAAIHLYSNKDFRQNAQLNGVDIVNNYYQKEIPGQDLINRLLEIQKDLDKHRQDNFVGAILTHHTVMSTKYMSKWIESKNKLNF